MPFNFDLAIERSGTNCVKYDLRRQIFGREDVIPMWVADMDFAVPPFVAEAIRLRAQHPVYGYSIIPETYYEAILSWQSRRHGWTIQKESVLFSPGVVTGLNMIVQAFTEPGDKIIVQPPVYFPFFSCVENNGRTLVVNRLAEDRGVYSIDFDDLERKMKEGARMLILCNPHNPVSRCWTREELEWVGRKCLEYGILVVSDEIHCDLVFSPHRHIPMATLSPEIEKITVTCIAPSKTFNLAGLFTSSIIITDEDLRRRFKTSAERIHLSPNIFGIVAAEAAYREGDQWLAELMGYLEGNIRKVGEFLARSMPGVTFSPPEATYMLWLDFRTLGLGDEELKDRLINEAGLGLVDGRIFGAGGAGFQRMNIGCPAAVVETALERLKKV